MKDRAIREGGGNNSCSQEQAFLKIVVPAMAEKKKQGADFVAIGRGDGTLQGTAFQNREQ